jgi:hypothetical protein
MLAAEADGRFTRMIRRMARIDLHGTRLDGLCPGDVVS